jgi:ubiquinone biosynthesis protein COQ4
VRIPEKDEVDQLLAHLFSTRDLWHVATGFGNDEVGEVGLGAFYLAQLPAPFFAFLFAFILLNTVFVKPQTLRERMEALVAGYQAGREAEPLFGVDWESLWDVPLHEVRARLGLTGVRVLGEGVCVAA